MRILPSISGLKGTKTTASQLPLTNQNSFETPALWNQERGELTLKPSVDIQASVQQCVTILVRNPAWGQIQQQVKIHCDILSHDQQNLGVTLGVSFPVYFAKIEQSSAFPCDVNTITVSLSSNVPIYGFCANKLTVTGLCGSTTPNSDQLPISMEGGSESDVGSWNGADGHVEIDLQSFIDENSFVVANDYITMRFDLTNQKCPQDGCSSSISVTGMSGLEADEDAVEWSVTGGNLQIGLNDKFPMKIVQAQLTTTLVQGGTHVCLESELNIVFRSNVPLKTACLPNITLFGMSWFDDPDFFRLTPINLIPGGGLNNPVLRASLCTRPIQHAHSRTCAHV